MVDFCLTCHLVERTDSTKVTRGWIWMPTVTGWVRSNEAMIAAARYSIFGPKEFLRRMGSWPVPLDLSQGGESWPWVEALGAAGGGRGSPFCILNWGKFAGSSAALWAMMMTEIHGGGRGECWLSFGGSGEPRGSQVWEILSDKERGYLVYNF